MTINSVASRIQKIGFNCRKRNFGRTGQGRRISETGNIAQLRAQTLRQATQNARMLFQNGKANYLEVITAEGTVLQN